MSESEVDKKNASTGTILAMFNNMLGGAMLTFPILFKDTGLISSSIVLILSALISFATCRIYVLHSSQEDKDVESTIRRLIGKKWEKYFRFITGCYLILLSIISLDLIVDQLYSIIYFFFSPQDSSSESAIADKDKFDFTKFSTQWLTLILFIPLLAVVSMKNLHFLVKLSQVGTISAVVYIIFVFVQFLVAAISGNINMDDITWFSFDAGSLAGTCGLAFTIHTVVITFMKDNQNQKNNMRDLGITYIMGFSLYEIVAVMGAFAISGKICTNTLVDCYLRDWTILFVQVSYFIARVAVFPCLYVVGRIRLIELFYQTCDDKKVRIFNIGFMVLATIFSIMSPYLPISILMSIVGAVVCYFFIYLIPTKIHYGCLYRQKVNSEESLIQSITSLENDTAQYAHISCNHDQNYVANKPAYVRHILYGLINAIGIAIGIFGLYSSVLLIMDK